MLELVARLAVALVLHAPPTAGLPPSNGEPMRASLSQLAAEDAAACATRLEAVRAAETPAARATAQAAFGAWLSSLDELEGASLEVQRWALSDDAATRAVGVDAVRQARRQDWLRGLASKVQRPETSAAAVRALSTLYGEQGPAAAATAWAERVARAPYPWELPTPASAP